MNDKKSSASFTVGLGFILFGLVFILRDVGWVDFYFADLWPVFPSIIAILLWANYFRDRSDYEILMPAAILSVYSIMFWLVTIRNYIYFEDLWPFFILGPAFGFWLMHFSKYSNKDYKIPALITSAIGLIFLYGNFYYIDGSHIVGIILVSIGLVFLLKKTNSENSNELKV